MFKTVTVSSDLADPVEKELHSVKVVWQYLPLTTKYYENATQQVKDNIDSINIKYGPVIDTQKFTYTVFNTNSISYNGETKIYKTFYELRTDPQSFYNRRFPGIAKLVNYLQLTYIPANYKVVRLICNMQTIRPSWSLNAPHPDFHSDDYITILYYVNNSDGDTLFFEGDECVHRVTPTKGTAAIYRSSMLHAGSTPTNHETRVVINMVFAPK